MNIEREVREVITKLQNQRDFCLAEAKKLALIDDDQEAHYRGQALALKDAIRLINQALSVGIN